MAIFEVSSEYTTKLFNDLDEVIDYITCNVSDETIIIDLLDEINGPVRIGRFIYSAGKGILRKTVEENSLRKYFQAAIFCRKYDPRRIAKRVAKR